MSNISLRSVLIAAIALTLPVSLAVPSAYAETLTGTVAADDSYTAYLSTDPSVLGTAIGSGNAWYSPSSVSSGPLTPGQTYYLQIVASNIDDNTAGVLGQFSIGSQTILTNTAWLGNENDTGIWSAPTGTVSSEGANSNTTTVWYGVLGHSLTQIDPNALWIWPSDAFTGPNGTACGPIQALDCSVDLMTSFTVPSTVPLPGTLPLFATGIGALGVLGWRKRRRAEPTGHFRQALAAHKSAAV